MSPATQPVLTDAIPGARVRDALLSLGFALAIALSAQVAFPLPGTSVPFTGQTFAVLVGAIVLGSGRAGLGAMLYLALGVLGLPWFAGAGPHTVGYLVGFVLAAAVVGHLVRRTGSRTPLQVIGAMVVGNLVIYACGATGLALVLGLDASQALAAGVAPFLVGDALKLLAAAAVVPAAWKLVGDDVRR
jgi:biotin transport system substrate-specific component